MTTIIYILIAVIAVLVIVNIAAIWLTRKGLTKDENNRQKASKIIMEDLKLYGISISALGTTIFSDINPVLSTLVLTATLAYTIIQITEKLKKK